MVEGLTLFDSNKPVPHTLGWHITPHNSSLSINSLARRSNNRLLSRRFLPDIKLKYSRTRKAGSNNLSTRISRLETHMMNNMGSKTTLTQIGELRPLRHQGRSIPQAAPTFLREAISIQHHLWHHQLLPQKMHNSDHLVPSQIKGSLTRE
jgi:hypothetical protein